MVSHSELFPFPDAALFVLMIMGKRYAYNEIQSEKSDSIEL